MKIGRSVSLAVASHAAIADAHHTKTIARTIATGTYTGDDAVSRQITVGFKCSLILLWNSTDATEAGVWVVIPNACWRFDGVSHTANIVLHATDGFTVSHNAADQGNDLNDVYYYWAISE